MSCEVCGKTTNLKSCGQCLKANYCGREHQKQHWEVHKRWCTVAAATASAAASVRNGTYAFGANIPPVCHQQPSQLQQTEAAATTIIDDLNDLADLFQQTSSSSSTAAEANTASSINYLQQQQLQQPANDMLLIQQPMAMDDNSAMMTNTTASATATDQLFGNNNSPSASSPNVAAAANTATTGNNVVQSSMMMAYYSRQHQEQEQQQNQRQESPTDMIQQQMPMQYPSPPYPAVMAAGGTVARDMGIMGNLHKYCQIILNDMNKYGFCVIDDFLQNGDLILNEVSLLYERGWFKAGQVVNMKANSNSQLVRGDKIIWVEGNERICANIGFLVRILDSIVSRCNAMALGEFSKYRINRRTKAMIACYPGNNSQYVRHVDNPNNDGRCITSIYYLNKDYVRERDGGVLRLFPQMNDGIVADIEPKFNRVIFFWSDRRNPHEVMPSTRRRFAITVWYFDANERAKAIQKYKENSKYSTFNFLLYYLRSNPDNSRPTMSQR